MARYQSAWSKVRLVLNPHLAAREHGVHVMDLESYGLLMRLLNFASFASLPADDKTLACVARISTRKLRKLWPSVSEFFELSADGRSFLAAPLEWCIPQVVSSDRRDLTWLLDALVDFWGSLCVYCGEAANLEIEHIVPLARGGTNEIGNLTVSCRTCNAKKRTKTAAEFGFPEVHERAKGLPH